MLIGRFALFWGNAKYRGLFFWDSRLMFIIS